jgi:hypothetical protein
LTDPVELLTRVDMRFETWNVNKLYSSGSLKTLARGLAKYRLKLSETRGIRWDKGGTGRLRIMLFSKVKKN